MVGGIFHRSKSRSSSHTLKPYVIERVEGKLLQMATRTKETIVLRRKRFLQSSSL